jgi:hypothetical protein
MTEDRGTEGLTLIGMKIEVLIHGDRDEIED